MPFRVKFKCRGLRTLDTTGAVSSHFMLFFYLIFLRLQDIHKKYGHDSTEMS